MKTDEDGQKLNQFLLSLARAQRGWGANQAHCRLFNRAHRPWQRSLFGLFVASLLSTAAGLDLSPVQEKAIAGKNTVRQWSFGRGGKIILNSTVTAPKHDGVFSNAIHTLRHDGKVVLAITFIDGGIASFFTGPSLFGVRIDVGDSNRDGVPDLIILESSAGEILDAYTIVTGAVAPVGEEALGLLRKREPEFFDKTLPQYINTKLNEAGAAGVPPPYIP